MQEAMEASKRLWRHQLSGYGGIEEVFCAQTESTEKVQIHKLLIGQGSLSHRRAMVLACPHAVLVALACFALTRGVLLALVMCGLLCKRNHKDRCRAILKPSWEFMDDFR